MDSLQLPTVKADAKQLIIRVLGKEWPLNARQVFSKIRAEHPMSITYQGVHKALKLLESERVVCRSSSDKAGFELDEQWVSRLKELSDQLHSRKVRKMPSTIMDMAEGESRTFEFKNVVYVEPFYWMIGEVLKVCEQDKRKMPMVFHQNKVWPLTVLSNQEYDVLRKMLENGDHYLLAASNGLMDGFLVDLWKGLKVRCMLGVPCAEKAEMIVFKDFVFQAFNSKKVYELDEKIWNRTNRLGKPDVAFLNKTYLEGKIDSKFVFTRNEDLANHIRKETIAHFK